MTVKNNSHDRVIIALDAMGGDHAPDEVIHGAAIALKDTDLDIFFKIYGDSQKVMPILSKLSSLRDRCEFIHAPQVVGPEEKPSSALRYFKNSSMQLSINAVKNKEADAAVSAGNTGALMAMSTITLKTIAQIHRPAIVTLMPSTEGKFVMLDLGANVECDANNLYQFAIMGEAFARIVLNKENPVVKILNIGSEELKGKDSIKLACSMLKETTLPINFQGYVEGNNMADGSTDVVVTDGFTGNVVLKTIQGYAKVYKTLAKKSLGKSLISKIQGLFVVSLFKKISSSMDPREFNGAMLIGLNGVVVKSHGSMDRVGICNAIKVAHSLSGAKINDQIAEELTVLAEVD